MIGQLLVESKVFLLLFLIFFLKSPSKFFDTTSKNDVLSVLAREIKLDYITGCG